MGPDQKRNVPASICDRGDHGDHVNDQRLCKILDRINLTYGL